LVTRQMSIL